MAGATSGSQVAPRCESSERAGWQANSRLQQIPFWREADFKDMFGFLVPFFQTHLRFFFSQQRSKNHPPTSSRQQTHIWSEKCHLPASSPPLLTKRRAGEGELLAGRPQETIGGQPLKKRHNSATRRVIPELQTVTEVGAFGRTLVCLGPRFGARRKV